jgi:hypothetical protein
VRPWLQFEPGTKCFDGGAQTGIVNGLPMTTAAFNETNPQIPEAVFTRACETLNQIIAIG